MRLTKITTQLTCLFMLASSVWADDPTETRKPDLAVEHQVQRELRSNFQLLSPDLHARVIAGRVELRGRVPSYIDRMRVEDVVEELAGVRAVQNRIRVNREGQYIHQQGIHQRVESLVGFRGESHNRDGQVSALKPTTKTVRGTIELIADKHILIRDFRRGMIEAELPKTAEVTLDGKSVDDQALRQGFLVLVEAKVDEGDLVAETVDAHSPK
ncbi:BON domain-containing protein [Stieleria sp. JC731]|uniref:BON domain-containing protein n=1 Tax=Pirellulaceae TaxID=2691357 RepID=UPI001E46B5E0|nr:BON domain-containing protein [Stieleria sp. JC731]MCC9598952.1 BON domain-containing protein [Stieleria sp. JC731]